MIKPDRIQFEFGPAVMENKEYRAYARQKLAGRWGISIVVSFVASILGGYFTYSFGSPSGNGTSTEIASENEITQQINDIINMFPTEILAGLLAGFVSLALIFTLVSLLIGSCVELGHKNYYIALISEQQENIRFGTLFGRFNIWVKAVLLRLFIYLLTFLWTLLLIIPGIIASYRYRLAAYLMTQNPELGVREAVQQSKELMYGYKGKLFCLDLSFIGWALLCVLTFGIGYLWLAPYMAAAVTTFYMDRTGQMTSGTAEPQGAPGSTAQNEPPESEAAAQS